MNMDIEEYAQQLDEEIVELKDEHQNLKSRLHVLLQSCNEVLSEAKREKNSVVISEGTFSNLRRNVKAVQESIAEGESV